MLLVFQVLPMEEREGMYRERAKERAQRAQDQYELDRKLAVRTDKQRNLSNTSSASVVPRTTHSFLVKTARVRARLEKEAYDLEQEKKRELRRRAQQQETSTALAEVMRQMGHKQTKQDRRVAELEYEQKARQGRERYRRALRENKARLEQVRENVLLNATYYTSGFEVFVHFFIVTDIASLTPEVSEAHLQKLKNRKVGDQLRVCLRFAKFSNDPLGRTWTLRSFVPL